MENKKTIDKIDILNNIKDTLNEWNNRKKTGILTFEIAINKGGIRGFNIIKRHTVINNK